MADHNKTDLQHLAFHEVWPGEPDPEAERVLVIPDLHNNVAACQHWLDTQRYDKAVLLGDYFDSFGDSASDALRTARWIKERLPDRRLNFLLGNHDLSYRVERNEVLLCPGYSDSKATAIRRTLTEEDWRRMKIVHLEGNWVLSHAGFHPAFMKSPTPEKLVERCALALARAARGVVDPIFSFDDGGIPRFAGPAWLAWENFVPVPGLNQVVGHTPGRAVRFKMGENSLNLCLDVNRGEAAVVIQGECIDVLRMFPQAPASSAS